MKALLTGANSLVNKAMLDKLATLGYEIVAHYHRENDVTAGIKQAHPEVTFLQADFADKTSFMHFHKQALELGPFDVVVNGAVYYAEASDWKPQLDWGEWQKTFAINTTAAGMLMARADALVKKGGVIVNVSSTYGQPYMGDMQFGMYSASKAGMDSLTAAYAKRWSPDIRVVGVAPGWVKSAWNKDMSSADVKNMIKPQLTHKLVEPAEIADLVETVIKNGSINATTLTIDGGLGAPII